jgi:hypothetical protein
MPVAKKLPGLVPLKAGANQGAGAGREVAQDVVTDDLGEIRLCARRGCGRMFRPYRSFQRYCTDRCRGISEKRRPSRYKHKDDATLTCAMEGCGKKFTTNDSKRRFCCPEHQLEAQAMRRKEPETRTCFREGCGNVFKTTHWLKRYCSAACRRLERMRRGEG